MSSTTLKAAIASLGIIVVLVVAGMIYLGGDGDEVSIRDPDGPAPSPAPEDSPDSPEGPAVESAPGEEMVAIPDREEIAVSVRVVEKDMERTLPRSKLQVLRQEHSERVGELVHDLPRPGDPRSADFSFALAPGHYMLQVRCRGYALHREELSLVAGQDPVDRVIALDRGTSISGRVLTESGEPVAGAEVGAYRDLASPHADLEELLIGMTKLESIQQETHHTTRSGPDGSYQIDGLQAGEYYSVRATAPSFSPKKRKGIPAPSRNVDLRLVPGGILEGVVRSGDGAPVEGATVEAYPELQNAGLMDVILSKARPPVDTGTSDSSGRYRLEKLGSGMYNFLVSAPGFQKREAKRIRVQAGSSTTRDFTLRPGHVIRGVVRGPGGRPLEGAKVRVTQMGGAASRRNQVAIDLGKDDLKTGADGLFEFDTLSEGTYSLIAWHSDYQSVQKRDLRPGSEELLINLPHGGQLEGVVLDRHTGRPIPGAQVSVSDVSDLRKEATTDADGQYFVSGLNSTRSNVRVNVRAEGYARTTDNVRLSANRKVRKDFELEGTGIVEGRVIFGNGVKKGQGATEARVEVRRFQESTGTRQVIAHGATDGEGWFVIEDVEPSAGLRLRVKKATYLDAYSEEFSVDSGERVQVAPVQLRLGGSVSGRVTSQDGTPVVGCMVEAYFPGETEMINQNNTTQTDSRGNYVMQGLEAGLVDLVFKSPSFINGRLENVEVREGEENQNRNVVLEAAGAVGGRVVDPSGRPISGAEILVQDFADGLRQHRAVTNVSGEFLVTSVVADDFVSVEATHGEYSTASKEDVPVGDREVEIVLQPLASMVGSVVDEKGEPIPSFSVQPRPLGTDVASQKARKRLEARTFSDGRFEYTGLPAGSYDVFVRSPSRSAAKLSGVPVGQGEVVDVGEIVLEAGGRVTGRVLEAASGSAVGGAKVRVLQGAGRFRRRLEGGSEGSRRTSKPLQTTADDGSFTFTGLKDGAVTLEVSHPSFGTKRVSGVDPAVAEKSLDLEIALERGGSLAGVVEDARGQAVAGMTVYLQSKGSGSRNNRSAPTDARGRFTFDNVTSGVYNVRAHKFVPGEKPVMGQTEVDLRAGEAREVRIVVSQSR